MPTHHVFFIKGERIERKLQIVMLPHPKYGKGTRYMWSEGSHEHEREAKLMEVQRSSHHPSSWFIGDYIESNGSFFVCTPVDPLFLALPFLANARAKGKDQKGYFIGLSQIIKSAEYPELSILRGMCKSAQLALICDVKDGWDATSKVYRLSDEKLLGWLKKKTDRLSVGLESHPSFDTLACSDEAKKHDASVAAIGLLSEYLSKDVLDVLMDAYGVTTKQVCAKQKVVKSYMSNTVTADGDTSRSEADSAAALKRKAEKPPAKKVNKKLAKVNIKGMKSMMSFFGGGGTKKKKK